MWKGRLPRKFLQGLRADVGRSDVLDGAAPLDAGVPEFDGRLVLRLRPMPGVDEAAAAQNPYAHKKSWLSRN